MQTYIFLNSYKGTMRFKRFIIILSFEDTILIPHHVKFFQEPCGSIYLQSSLSPEDCLSGKFLVL